ncbi:uncharacterized protein MYCFIDRAFT_78286 [Pseudocercospora fijiensis CIRAD86]|uniref:D-isomer specific 2-hydroxyacid dehydrogenase NAD-binding domain-containing protein n=1 Tax=Pseudocercospora fijiensis (strain CIRAD86) TaxID=383855 RepID=M3ASW9_PSEFD|nr:uncharacterized protein MYCFIDRAFT_78286 [Pseudocercospora fijiensis CIRAD86]EME80587.1 hypothetical protein MYCFIDRAFT_78286 [Pseudocercospora fijiensis CIRAD86]
MNTLFGPVTLDICRDVHILVTLAALPQRREDCPNLKYCHFLTAGFNYVAKSSLFMDPSIRWTSSSGIHAPAVAEWIFMAYIAHQREYDAQRQAQLQRQWRGYEFHAMQHHRGLSGQRLGILGYGNIGRHVAKVAAAFNMDVIAYTATARESSSARLDNAYRLPGTGDPEGTIPSLWFHGTEKADIHRFLAQNLDILVICLPLTEKTRYLLGKEEFDVLRNGNSGGGGTFICNVSRGEIIQQEDLINALSTESSGIRGAALDVQSPEPLPPDSPLWKAPNCFITPHNSSQDDRYLLHGLDILLINLGKSSDQRLVNEVDRTRKY